LRVDNKGGFFSQFAKESTDKTDTKKSKAFGTQLHIEIPEVSDGV
jgi:hypothetical protein